MAEHTVPTKVRASLASDSVREQVLKRLGDGFEYDPARGRIVLTGRSKSRAFKRVTRFLSYAERAHPNRGNWKDPETGLYSYPEARRAS